MHQFPLGAPQGLGPERVDAVTELPPDGERAALQDAAWHRLAVHGLGRFRHPDAAPRGDAQVVGYTTPSDSAWAGALGAVPAGLQR